MIHSDDVMNTAEQLRQAGTPFVLATVVRCESPTSAKPGAKAVITAEGEIQGWIGGGCAQPAVLDSAKKALKDGQPRLIRISPTKGGEVEPGIVDFGMTCHSGGTLDIFIDPFIARPALLIIGASPAAQTLGVLAHHAGFAVQAAFPGADSEMFPLATQIIDGFDLSGLPTETPPLVVVATQGKRDEGGLEAALTTTSPYIAFIASERKADKLRSYLKERGHDAERVGAIISPAGIEISATTPEEIAVSVLAGLIQARRSEKLNDPVAKTSATSCCGSETVQTSQASSCCGTTESKGSTAIDPVCGMSVQIQGAEHVTEYQDQSFYFCCAGCLHSFEKDPQSYLASKETS